MVRLPMTMVLLNRVKGMIVALYAPIQSGLSAVEVRIAWPSQSERGSTP